MKPDLARRVLIVAALTVMAFIFFGSLLRRNAPVVQDAKPRPALTIPATPVPTPTPLSSAFPRLDPQAGTGAADPTEAAATGARFASTVPQAAQQKAAENDPKLQAVAFALRDYRAALGQNPVGSNPEITRALQGENARHSKFLREELPVNAQGEAVDQWGTPYFFHQISGTRLDVYSAGPDRTLWTDDDEITR